MVNFDGMPSIYDLYLKAEIPDIEEMLKNDLITDHTQDLNGAQVEKIKTQIEEGLADHKKHIKIGCGKAIKIIESNMTKIQELGHTDELAKTFDELIAKRKEKESHFGIIHLFCHKVMQKWQGHGFCTKATYAEKVSAKLKGQLDEKEIRTYFSTKSAFSGYPIATLKTLTPDQIRDYTKKNVFCLERMLESIGQEVDKFLTCLTDDQKKAFYQGVCERPDAVHVLEQIVRFDFDSEDTALLRAREVKGNAEKNRDRLEHFPVNFLVEKLVSSPSQFEKILRSGSMGTGTKKITEIAAYGCLQSGDYMGLVAIAKRFPAIREELKKLGEENKPFILTDDQIQALRENTKLVPNPK